MHFFFERLAQKGRDVRDLKGIKICCIGPATARQIEERGIRVDLVPKKFIAEGILESFAAMDLKGQKMLIPRATVARDILPENLRKKGAEVDVAPAYQTVHSGRKKEELLAWIDGGAVDVITFTSSSTVNNFIEIAGADFMLPPRVKIACIGPVTAAAAKKAGFQIDISEEEYTMEGLVNALVHYFQRKSSRTDG